MQGTRFDVVVTDLNMPGMSGLDLIRRIRASSDCPETIVLTCSGPQEAPRAVEALRLGAHDYLTKPPQSAEVIVSAVDRALETKRRRDESVRFLEDLRALTPPLQPASAHC
jgi:two-component system C4-dicarboxylate transport response regulator DctD